MAVTDVARAWAGPEGEWWARQWRRHERLVAGYQGPLLAAGRAGPAAPQVLDVGCGAGGLALDLARSGAEAVVGIDVARPLLTVARRRAGGRVPSVSFVHGDAQRYRFPVARFDCVVSRFGLMFFDDPVAAFANLASAQVAGGRLAALVWRPLDDNEWLMRLTAACAPGGEPIGPPAGRPGAFGMADPAQAATWLAAGGYTSVGFEPCDRPLYLGRTVAEALEFTLGFPPVRSLLSMGSARTVARRRRRLEDVLASALGPGGVRLGSGAWLVTARAAG